MISEILQFVLIMLSAIYVTLGFHILTKSWTAKVNRMFFLFCLSLSLWALGYALMINAGNSTDANRWRIFSSLGWCFFYAHWFCFSAELTGYGKRFGRFGLVLVYLPAFWFFYQTVNLYTPEIFMRTQFGWVPVYPSDINQIQFMLYYLFLLLSALVLVFRWGRSVTQIRYKEQANVICISVIISLILGATTDTLMPLMGFVMFPMGVVFIVIGVSGIWFAIVKYKMLGITMAYIADMVVRVVDTPILILSENLRIERLNSAAARLIGCREEDGIGRELKASLPFEASTMDRIQSGRGFEGEAWLDSDEGIQYFMVTVTTLQDEYGDDISKVMILSDITETKRAEAIIAGYGKNLEHEVEHRTRELERANLQLEEEIQIRKLNEAHAREMLYFDDLTGLPNRFYFKEKSLEAIEEARRSGKETAFICLDLDDFKYINESLGHYTGDEMLRRVGLMLTEHLPDHCIIAHSGGDEFHILIGGTEEEDVFAVSRDIVATILGALRTPFVIGGKELFITASMGVAYYAKDGSEFITLMKHADSALFEAKQRGKNTAVFSDERIKARIDRMADLRNRLYRALEMEEFYLCYQPQVNLSTSQITGFEALIRWNSKESGFVSPSEFIPLAEENGLIIPIGYWVIETAARKALELEQKGFGHMIMAVNISVNQLRQKDFVERTTSILKEIGLSPSLMEFEVTERVGFKGFQDAEDALFGLQRQGIRISIDDFGTDYSSFMNIKRMPVDKVKIAMEFVRGIEENAKDAAIVQTMVEMSRNMALQVIAEGAETQAQVDYLREIRCQEVQGYFFYRPVRGDELERILEQERYGKIGEDDL